MLCFIELFSEKLVLPSSAVTLIGCTSCSALTEVIVADKSSENCSVSSSGS